MGRCKCRYCSANLTSDNAYRIAKNKIGMYFCNQEHYVKYVEQAEKKKAEKAKLIAQEKEEQAKLKARQKEEHMAEEQAQKEKRKADKDKAYWLICEIIGRKEIINTVLWKEWAIWNKVASNETIGRYLEENKTYLINTISNLDNIELIRIRYLSAILKNKLGDYSRITTIDTRPKIQTVEETFYEPVTTNNNKRRSLADLEDDF